MPAVPSEQQPALDGALDIGGNGLSASTPEALTSVWPDPCRGIACVPSLGPCTYGECPEAKLCGVGGGQSTYVNAAYGGAQDGTRARPFTSVQKAIDAAGGDAVVRVATGRYRESLQVNDKTVHLCGGWSPDFSTRDTRVHPTTLEGPSRQTSVVSLVNARQSTVVGFHIRGGKLGLWVESQQWPPTRENSSPRIADNVIEDNGAASMDDAPAGAIGLGGGYIAVLGNTLRNNQGGRGSALRLAGVDVLIAGNHLDSNTGGSDHGGAVFSAVEQATFSGNLFQGNVVGTVAGYGWGGAMIVLGGAEFIGNVWTDNHAPSHGGALFIDEGAEVTMRHDVFFGNRCSKEGGNAFSVDGTSAGAPSRVQASHLTVVDHDCEGQSAILMEASSELSLVNSILWNPDSGQDLQFQEQNCSVNLKYSVVGEIAGDGGRGNRLQRGPGIQNVAPLFVDPERRDYHLQSQAGHWDVGRGLWVTDPATSPGVDAGDPATVFDREAKPNGGRVNLGAFGNTPQASRSKR